jgi:hypothetical protein
MEKFLFAFLMKDCSVRSVRYYKYNITRVRKANTFPVLKFLAEEYSCTLQSL